MDVATGRITRLPGFEGARHSNPQWSPDGASLFFVADPDGISNVFRVDLAGGPIAQVTDLFTGVSGITETSPALSVAQRSGRLVYSVFRANGYEVYAIDSTGGAGRAPLHPRPGRQPGCACCHRSSAGIPCW